jgi:lysophospholipid acyltransferase (LPLAT)-like uncharacterized protein
MTGIFQELYAKLKRFRKRIKNHPLVKYVDIFCVSMLSRVAFRVCSRSIHIDHQNNWIPEAHWQSGKNMIIAFWHNRLCGTAWDNNHKGINYQGRASRFQANGTLSS